MADIDVKRIDEMIYYLKAGELADMEILLEAITRTLDDETQASTINELNVCKQMLDEINQLLQTVEQNKQRLGERLNLLADGDNFENRRLEQKKEIYEPFKEEIVKFIKRMDNMKEFKVPIEAKGNFSKSIDDYIDNFESSGKSVIELEEYKSEIELDFKMAKNNLERAQEFLGSYLSFKLI